MTRDARLLFTPGMFSDVQAHLFPGDGVEHAGALLCGWHQEGGNITLTTRRFFRARDGVDYTVGPELYGRLQPLFIERALSEAKAERLAYLAIHNHAASDRVGFSRVDMASHAYGYPTLLRLNKGLPVGAAVFGTNSVEVDIWMPDGSRHQLSSARIVGRRIRHLWAAPAYAPAFQYDEQFDRQLPFLRNSGQGLLADAVIAIVGVGGLGSQLIEPLVRLGIRRFILIDPDRLDWSNYSRVHGALPCDLPVDGRQGAPKVNIAKRLIYSIAPDAAVKAHAVDVARGDSHRRLLGCDFIFLAADTAEARFTCNAVMQQYFIPGVQVGAKVNIDTKGILRGIFGAVRHVRPGTGCLWCNGLVDRVELANAGKAREQRENERYGVQAPNPAVVTFNQEVAARSLNDFLSCYASSDVAHGREADYTILDLLSGEREQIEARMDPDCPFCSSLQHNSALGLCDATKVPVVTS